MNDRELVILLKLLSDTAGAAPVKAEIAAINALQADQAKLLQQMNAPAAAQIDIAQARVVQETLINAQMERRVVMETQLEAAEAKIAGNPAMAAKLEREAAIRTQALTIQRALNITTEESIVLAERMVVAQEATAVGTGTMGVNISKARQEAIVLFREMAAGNVRASTVSAELGAWGTTLTIAGIAAYELYQLIAHSADQMLDIVKSSETISTEIYNAAQGWDQLATRAQSFGDKVKLADKIKGDLDHLSLEMEAFRLKELGFFAKWADEIAAHFGTSWTEAITRAALIVPTLGASLLFPSSGERQLQEKADKAKLDAQEHYNQDVIAGNVELDKTQKKIEAWAAAQADLPQGLADYSVKLSEAEAKLAQLDAARQANPKDPAALNAFVDQLNVVKDLRQEVKQLHDEYDKMNQKAASDAKRAAQQELNALLREEATLLQGIGQQRQLVAGDPFLSADAKQEQLRNLYLREQIAILAEIAKLKLAIKEIEAIGGPKEQAEVAQLDQKIQALDFRFKSLGQSIQLLTLGGQLSKWVQDWGSSTQQIAAMIEGTINATLQGTNQLLLDAAFRTGNWQQTIVGVERQVGNLFLTFMEKQIEQFILGETHKATSTATSIMQAGAKLTAEAPVAAATSISSYGAAAIIGEIAAIAAIVAIMAALGGGFKKGGFTGSGDEDEIAGPAHKNEFIFSKAATENIGVARLAALHDAAPHFGSGGRIITPDTPPIGWNSPSGFPTSTGFDSNLDINWNSPARPTRPTIDTTQMYTPEGWYVDAPSSGDRVPDLGHFSDPRLDPGTGIRPLGFAGEIPRVPNIPPLTPARGMPGYKRPGVVGPLLGPDPSWFNFTPGIGTQFPWWNNLANLSPFFNLPGNTTFALGNSPAYVDPGYINPGYTGPPPPADVAALPTATIDPTITGSSPGSSPRFDWSGIVTPPGSTIVGHDTVTGAPVYQDPTGKLFVPPGIGSVHSPDYVGYGTSAQSAADLILMASQSYGGDPNEMRGTSEEGHIVFGPGQYHMLGATDTWGTGGGRDWIHGAEGLRVPGAPSKIDTQLAWLAPGEEVIPADITAHLDRIHGGADWTHRLADMRVPIPQVPHFQLGGRAGGSNSSDGSQRGAFDQKPPQVNLAIFDDPRKLAKWLESSDEGQKIIIDVINRSSHMIGNGSLAR